MFLWEDLFFSLLLPLPTQQSTHGGQYKVFFGVCMGTALPSPYSRIFVNRETAMLSMVEGRRNSKICCFPKRRSQSIKFKVIALIVNSGNLQDCSNTTPPFLIENCKKIELYYFWTEKNAILFLEKFWRKKLFRYYLLKRSEIVQGGTLIKTSNLKKEWNEKFSE